MEAYVAVYTRNGVELETWSFVEGSIKKAIDRAYERTIADDPSVRVDVVLKEQYQAK